jgi:hypothetical protein
MTDAQLTFKPLSAEPTTLNSDEVHANGDGTPDFSRHKDKHFLNADEAADVLRMDSRTLVRWARLGQVPAHPMGEGKRRLWRFIEAELIHWLAERGTPLKKPVANTIETAIGAHARRSA